MTELESVLPVTNEPSKGMWNRIVKFRQSLNLPCPGPFENLHRELRGTLI